MEVTRCCSSKYVRTVARVTAPPPSYSRETHLPNREALPLRVVLAWPKASRTTAPAAMASARCVPVAESSVAPAGTRRVRYASSVLVNSVLPEPDSPVTMIT